MTTNPNRDVRDDLLHAIDFNYASSLGYDSPEAFLAAYDTSRTAAVPEPADRAATLREQEQRADATERLVPRAVRPLDIEHDELMARAAAEHQARTAADQARKTADRAAVLREAAAAIEAAQAREEATAWAQSDEPDPEIEIEGGAVRAMAALLRRLADEEQPAAGSGRVAAEDPARIDRLRPEFTEHASVESIDVQLRRARSQQRRWHLRVEWLISLRQARMDQKACGEWPAAVERSAAADTSEEAGT